MTPPLRAGTFVYKSSSNYELFWGGVVRRPLSMFIEISFSSVKPFHDYLDLLFTMMMMTKSNTGFLPYGICWWEKDVCRYAKSPDFSRANQEASDDFVDNWDWCDIKGHSHAKLCTVNHHLSNTHWNFKVNSNKKKSEPHVSYIL